MSTRRRMCSQRKVPPLARPVGEGAVDRPVMKRDSSGHPLGPLVYRRGVSRPGLSRVWAGLVLAGCCGILGLSAWLSPHPSGMGTHRQLGFTPCTMVVMTGYPCPTCGMTTAFAYTVRGRFLLAFHAQPAGLVFALATFVCAGVALGVILTGQVWVVNWFRVSSLWVTLVVVGLLVVGWAYKIVVGLASGALPAN